MAKFEISFRDNGILKNRCFKYRDQYERCLTRILKNPKRYTEIRTIEDWKNYKEW